MVVRSNILKLIKHVPILKFLGHFSDVDLFKKVLIVLR